MSFGDPTPTFKLRLTTTSDAVNRSRKRVVVVFRGSVVLKDFIIDAKIIKKTPSQIKQFAGRKVDGHRGFADT